MKKYYIDRYGNYCSYNYIPNITEADGMTEISTEEFHNHVAATQKAYEEAIAEQTGEATEADYIAALERFGVE